MLLVGSLILVVWLGVLLGCNCCHLVIFVLVPDTLLTSVLSILITFNIPNMIVLGMYAELMWVYLVTLGIYG